MAKLKNIVHSEDACTMIFKGNKKTPEPTTGIIKFPGGHVEVARTSNGNYWCHINVDDAVNIVNSRVEYDYEGYLKHHIPKIPDQDSIKHIAVECACNYQTPTGE